MDIEELKRMDVLDSMTGNIRAINEALDALGGGRDAEILEAVYGKLVEVDEIYERPLESHETWVRLKGIATARGDTKLERYCQSKLDLLEANRLHSEGYLWLFYGDCVKAAELLRRALKLAPGHPFAGKDLETAEKRLAKAREDLAKAERQIEKDPGSSKAWLGKATALTIMGRTDDALIAFDRAIALDPGNPDALARKGAVLEGLGKFDEAVALFNRAIDIKPTSRTANKGLSVAEYFMDGGN